MLQAEQGSNSIGTTCLGMEWKGWIHDKQRGFLTDGDLEIKCGVCFSFGFFRPNTIPDHSTPSAQETWYRTLLFVKGNPLINCNYGETIANNDAVR